jgi:hypothetical protein
MPAGTRNQQIGRNNYCLGISTNQSRKLLTLLPDMSARRKVNFSRGRKSIVPEISRRTIYCIIMAQ